MANAKREAAVKAMAATMPTGVGFDWSILIDLLIGLIPSLPCLQGKSASDSQKWLEDHPIFARVAIAQQARKLQPKLKPAHAGKLADRVVDTALGMSAAELKAVMQ